MLALVLFYQLDLFLSIIMKIKGDRPHCRASGGMAIFLGVSAAPYRILLSEFSYAPVQHSLPTRKFYCVVNSYEQFTPTSSDTNILKSHLNSTRNNHRRDVWSDQKSDNSSARCCSPGWLLICETYCVVYILFHFLKLKKIDNSPSAIVIYWVQY